ISPFGSGGETWNPNRFRLSVLDNPSNVRLGDGIAPRPVLDCTALSPKNPRSGTNGPRSGGSPFFAGSMGAPLASSRKGRVCANATAVDTRGVNRWVSVCDEEAEPATCGTEASPATKSAG